MQNQESEGRLSFPQREEWHAYWLSLLGEPDYSLKAYREAGLKNAEKYGELICDAPEDGFEVVSWFLPVGPQEKQKVILLRPKGDRRKQLEQDGKLPCAVIPFYQPETSAGLELDSQHEGLRRETNETEALRHRQYGLDLVRQGYLVICAEAYPFNMVPQLPENVDPFSRWPIAADYLNARYPKWTGLGKLVHDTQCAITFLLQQPDADASRLAIMGHSLGGKMAFYTGCLDERIQAVVASDFGLLWDSTNWQDTWYLGDKRPSSESEWTHEKLLALLAPRGFFLIAGETDHEASWKLLDPIRPLFSGPGLPPDNLAWYHHGTGHRPPPESLAAAYTWLKQNLGAR